MSALSADTDTSGGTAGASGAELPSVAGNSDFSGDSVAISGQSGQVSPLAGVDMDQIRDAIAAYQAANPGQELPGAGGLFGGGGGFGGGGFGGGGFGGPWRWWRRRRRTRRRWRRRRGNFRGFNPGQPHGAIFWMGSNSALNAEPFSLRGQPQSQPASGTNRFGLTFMSAPYIPHLTKPSGKDTVFLTLSGSRSSNPEEFYATVPTHAERSGDFSAAGLPAIYNPATQQQFTYNGTPNVIPPASIASQATALLKYFPEPNLTGSNAGEQLQLPPADHRAIEHHAGGRALHAQPGRERDAAGRRARRIWRRRRRRGRNRTRACGRASTSTTTGPTRPPTT